MENELELLANTPSKKNFGLISPHLVCIRVRECYGGVITEFVCNEMLKGRRESHTRCQGDAIVEVPELENSSALAI
jgi:hypothetical protein